MPKDIPIPKIEYLDLLTSLTKFTYFTPDQVPDANFDVQKKEHDAVAWFLERNCPNLQHLTVKLSSRNYIHALDVGVYCTFALVILGKPIRKTPKTFVGLDTGLIYPVADRVLYDVLTRQLLREWKFVPPNAYHSPIESDEPQ